MTAVDARFAGGPVLVDTAELGCTGEPVVGLEAPGYYVDFFAHEARALAAALISAANVIDKKNAPAAGSNQREGENQNPTKGTDS